MYTLGHDFIPPGIHAGGLRYHGMAPIVSAMVREKMIDPVKVHQLECFEAGVLFAKTEGIEFIVNTRNENTNAIDFVKPNH